MSAISAAFDLQGKLDTGAIVRSSMANTRQIDMDAYGLSQRVVAWFTPDDCMVLGNERAPHLPRRPARFAAIAPCLDVLFFLVPFGFSC